MNSKFLVLTSFLIALLCHIFVFNSFTIIFPIDPESPKPKLFFLGSILKKGEIKQLTLKNSSPQSQTTLNQLSSNEDNSPLIQYETADSEKNPFTIQAIKKPLIPQTSRSEEKAIIKSTFEIPSEEELNEAPKTQRSDQALEIRPYQPLQFRLPKNAPAIDKKTILNYD